MTKIHLRAPWRLSVVAVSLASSALAALAVPPTYVCEALPDGATSPETSHAVAGGINSKNVVVGTGTGTIFGQVSNGPMQWSKARVGTRLPDDSNTGNASTAYAAEINSAGKSVGAILDTNGQPRPVAWQNGALIELRSLASDGRGHAVAVNGFGTVVGKSIVHTTRGDVDRATLWKPNGRVVRLATRSTRDSSVAVDVSEQEGVAVGMVLSASDSRVYPVIWQDGETVELPNPPEATSSSVRAVNGRRSAVGSSFYSAKGTHATFWRGTEPFDLGGYRDNDSTYAVDINDLGDVVGYSLDSMQGSTPLFWDGQTAEAIDLNDMVVGGCVDAFGIQRRLTSVGAISPKGVVTATASVSEAGQTNSFAFRLVPR